MHHGCKGGCLCPSNVRSWLRLSSHEQQPTAQMKLGLVAFSALICLCSMCALEQRLTLLLQEIPSSG